MIIPLRMIPAYFADEHLVLYVIVLYITTFLYALTRWFTFFRIKEGAFLFLICSILFDLSISYRNWVLAFIPSRYGPYNWQYYMWSTDFFESLKYPSILTAVYFCLAIFFLAWCLLSVGEVRSQAGERVVRRYVILYLVLLVAYVVLCRMFIYADLGPCHDGEVIM